MTIKNLPCALTVLSCLSFFSYQCFGSGDESRKEQSVSLEDQIQDEMDWEEELSPEDEEVLREFLQTQLHVKREQNEEKILSSLREAIGAGDEDKARGLIQEVIPDLTREGFVAAYHQVAVWGDLESLEFLNQLLTPGVYRLLNDVSAPFGRHELIQGFATRFKIEGAAPVLLMHTELEKILSDRRSTIEALIRLVRSNEEFETAQIPLLTALDRQHYIGASVLALVIDQLKNSMPEPTSRLSRQISVLKELHKADLLDEALENELVKRDPTLKQLVEFSRKEDGNLGAGDISLMLETESGTRISLPLSFFRDGLSGFESKVSGFLDSREAFEKGILEAVREKNTLIFISLLNKGKDFLSNELLFRILNEAAESGNSQVAEMFAKGLDNYEHLNEVSFKTKSFLLAINEADAAGSDLGWYFWNRLSEPERRKPENSPAYFQIVAKEVFKAFLADGSSFPYTKKGLAQLLNHLRKEPGEFRGRDSEALLPLQQKFSFANLLGACVHWNKNLAFPPDIRTALR